MLSDKILNESFNKKQVVLNSKQKKKLNLNRLTFYKFNYLVHMSTYSYKLCNKLQHYNYNQILSKILLDT